MYHPTTRLLTILELLQTNPHMSGEEMARRLEVETRTIRRYVQMLQEMGMPVESVRGPGGGYRLRPGFKLPPLLFTEEEATAIVLGLLGTPWLEIDLPAVAIEGALAKVYRVLPLKGRERLQAISTYTLFSSSQQEKRPDASLLIKISEAIQQHQRLTIDYCSHHNKATRRQIEPYGIAGWKGHWYVAAHCVLRQAPRLFRLDRIHNIENLTETFERTEDFDYQAYIIQQLGTIPATWQIEVEFQAELHIVKMKIPATYGELSLTENGVLLRTHHCDLPTMARYLMGLNLPFMIHQPSELKEALREIAEEMLQIASS